MISMCGHHYSKENVEMHRKRIDDAAAKRLEIARGLQLCECGATIRTKYMPDHMKTVSCKLKSQKKNDIEANR